MRTLRLATSLAPLLIVLACTTPVGVERLDARAVHRELTASALSSDSPSAPSLALLTRLDMRERFARDPEGTLAELHAGLAASGDEDRLFALAELSFLTAERARRRAGARASYALAAAVYAHAFLFPGVSGTPPSSWDPRLGVARQVLNRGLTLGLESPDGAYVVLEDAVHPLPFGQLTVTLEPDALRWAGYPLERFVPAAELGVRGLRNRYRRPGLGAPLAASLGEGDQSVPDVPARIPRSIRVPVTAFLHLEHPRADLASGALRGRLGVYSEHEGPVLEVDGDEVPLESEPSAALALTLEGSPIWDFAFAGFRLGDFLPGGHFERLVLLRPLRRDRIPLVLVHGTFSSPATWAETVNELQNHPLVAARYQIWLFVYNTGNPIAYSGGILVQSLRDVMAELDPAGDNPLLQRMVVVGHSQGGLLTRLTVVDSGDRFWRNLSRRPFDEVRASDETRTLLERSLFYEPLPFVRRVVFIATPHRGSRLALFRPSRWISRLVKLPTSLSTLALDLAVSGSDALLERPLKRLPTSLDNMTPSNEFLRTLSELPIAPHVTAHSIIAVRGDGPVESGWDGVVAFESARLEGVASELVVRSGHSVQGAPQAVAELERILVENAEGIE